MDIMELGAIRELVGGLAVIASRNSRHDPGETRGRIVCFDSQISSTRGPSLS